VSGPRLRWATGMAGRAIIPTSHEVQAHVIVWKTLPSLISYTILIQHADLPFQCIWSRTEYIQHSGAQLQRYQRPYIKLIRLPIQVITGTFHERISVSKSHEKYKMIVWIKSYIFLPNIHYWNVSKIIQSSLQFCVDAFSTTRVE